MGIVKIPWLKRTPPHRKKKKRKEKSKAYYTGAGRSARNGCPHLRESERGVFLLRGTSQVDISHKKGIKIRKRRKFFIKIQNDFHVLLHNPCDSAGR